MRGYLFSLTAAALLSALVLALIPEGSVRRTVRLGCGLLLALTALSPLLKLDYDAIAKQIAGMFVVRHQHTAVTVRFFEQWK